jgi:hypothetical protein
MPGRDEHQAFRIRAEGCPSMIEGAICYLDRRWPFGMRINDKYLRRSINDKTHAIFAIRE